MIICLLPVLPLKYSAKSTACHELFIKEHSVRILEENKPAGLTLFVLNIPPYATEDSIKNVFSPAGKIKKVTLERTEENYRDNDGFQRGFIAFFKCETLLRALKLEQLNPLSSDDKPLKFGLEQYKCEYNNSISDPSTLKAEAEKYLRIFEETEKPKKSEEVVDDEGWTVVTKAGRKPGLSRKTSVANKLIEKTNKGSKRKELKNFYTFQIREGKMKKIAELRKNFEEAKEKVNLIKKSRKFKPI